MIFFSDSAMDNALLVFHNIRRPMIFAFPYRFFGYVGLVFYRASQCVSVVFAVVLCVCPSVRLSVHLSRWCIVSARLKISLNFFLGPLALSF